MKNILSLSKRVLSVVSVLAIASSLFVSVAQATVVPVVSLAVTGIDTNQSYATADNTFADGWKWTFHVTVPTDQTILKMKFDDWTNGSNIIPASDNIRFYSANSTNASASTSAITINSAGVYSDLMLINPNIDNDSSVQSGGRQIDIVVEARVPTGSAGGSYSTSYGINTTAPATITLGDSKTYNGTGQSVDITTNPEGLSTIVTYDGSATLPVNAGTYTVAATITDPGYTGTTTGTFTITPASVTATADPKSKVYDNATSTDPALTYTHSPLFGSDTFTGALSRDPGESVNGSPYIIHCNTLALDSNYTLTCNPSTFVITQASSSISLSDLTQTYDKTEKSVGVTTIPADLSTSITYDGLSTLPMNAGTYAVVATITDPNYTGSTSANLVINPAPITVTAVTDSKTYDGTTSSVEIPVIAPALFDGDTATTSQTFDTKNFGSEKTLTPSITITDDNGGNNYAITPVSATGSITPATATVSAVGINKVYDGTTAATVNLSVSGNVPGDTLVATDTATFDTKDVGVNKTVTVTGITLSGAPAGDYNYNDTATTTADITPTPLTITANNATKTYGDTVNFAGTEFTTSGLLDDDNVASTTLSSDGATSTALVSGSPYEIVVSNATGTGLGNYGPINYVDGNLVVNPKPITANITADGKTYDGNTTANITNCSLGGVVNSDPVTCNATGNFNDRNVGTGKTVTAAVNLVNDGGNYTVTSPVTTTADIAALPITVTAVTDTKIYDGNTSSVGIPTITAGALVGGDTATTSQVFDSKDIGNRSLFPSIVITDGNGGNNYAVTHVDDTTGTITARDLAVTAVGIDKIYDGTTDATVTLSDDRIAGDSLTDSYTSASFADKNVANNIPVSVGSISISGTDAGNYNLLNTTATTTADITQAPLTITANDTSKTYGSTTTFAGTEFTTSPNPLFDGDSVTSVTLTSGGATSTAPVSGSPYEIVASNATGTGLGNYAISYADGKLAVIKKPLTGTIVASDKTYDGTTNASTTCSLNDVVNGDAVTCNATGNFNDKNVGTGKTVTADISLVNDGGNYTVNPTATANATISQLAITVTAQPNTKTYDGTTAATTTPTVTPSLGSGDTANFIETYGDKNVGTGLTLTPSGVVNDGNSGNNYSYTFDTNTEGVINAEALTITASTNTKTYDGNTSASAIPTVTSGTVFGGDTGNFIETYDNATAGSGKILTPAGTVGDGFSGADYTYNFVANNTGVITQATPTFTYNILGNVSAGTDISAVISLIDATSSLSGSFSYNPQSGTVSSSTPLTLQITFTPTDLTNYSTVTKTTTISVSN